MLILGEFFKTQSDQNIHQKAPNFIIFSKFKSLCVQLCNNYFHIKIAI